MHSTSHSQVIELLEGIRQAFIESVPSLDWMDEATKASAIDKASKVTNRIGFPDFIQDKDLLDDYYSDVSPQ
jgi:predicted metalloendopeptidase